MLTDLTSPIMNPQRCDPLPLTSKRSGEGACFVLHFTHTRDTTVSMTYEYTDIKKFQLDLQIQGMLLFLKSHTGK